MINALNWFKTHKPETALGAGGIAVTVVLALRARSQASSGTSSATTSSGALPTSVADTTDSDAYNGIEDQVLGLQTAVLGLSSPQPAPATAPAPTAVPSNPYSDEVQQGSGFWDPGDALAPIAGLDGGEYVNLPSGTGSSSPAAVYGGTEYIQAAPGVFSPWTSPTQAAPGTPVFAKAST